MLARAAVLLLAAFPAVLLAQSQTFDLKTENKVVGHDTYSMSKAKQGFKITSHYEYRADGREGEFANEYKLADDYAFGEISVTDNTGHMHSSYVPTKARTAVTVSRFQAGAQDSTSVPIKTDLMVLPPYDVGAAQAVLLLATTHPSTNGIYSVIIPDGGKGGPAAVEAKWLKGREVTGTLDGKPVTLSTYLLATTTLRMAFFADSNNTLMQCDLPQLKTSYIRSKFKLDAVAPILAPAPGDAAKP